jgi:dihydrofolate reductase
MEHFKQVTHNQIVVMGQKTFESIGKPLVNRLNVVISDDPNFNRSDVKIFRSIQDVINEYKNHHIYIIGGKSIYETFAPLADEYIVSKIKKDYHCNRFLNIDFSQFQLVKTIKGEIFNAE